ncbi:hypothetical protein AVEN_229391-1 [Araneus ventricosus]|uniref:RNase H type-1 domain-containing protein n=1 Tax=Araneus ventricosus TaxID=182803 RepID=A0A4Y2SWB5_ARAVE|nr:hypothetical protein AVEN_229391-1 [Araneus ventricosus]
MWLYSKHTSQSYLSTKPKPQLLKQFMARVSDFLESFSVRRVSRQHQRVLLIISRVGDGRDIIWKEEIRLSDETSAFVAEAVAIQMAVEKVGPIKEKNSHFFGSVDCRSVLMALESNKNYSEIIMKFRKFLLVNPQIKLNWVRAHIGIYGNELADLSAKNATTQEEVDIK